MNIAFIIPTGIGCTIGGHAGDATPAAKLIAQCCDKLILHPNVVNASDINEMPENALYVEGSILDRFLLGEIELQEIRSNRVLVAVNSPLKPETANAINAARATIGMEIEIMELTTPLIMKGWIEGNKASGEATGIKSLVYQTRDYNFDALAIATPIDVEDGVAIEYFRSGRINPWGFIEAKVSREIADCLDKPVAHAPVETDNIRNDPEMFMLPFMEIVDQRKAAEVISNCFIHCILKGLHKAPRIGRGINKSSIGGLVSPTGCIGSPHVACLEAGIPVIAVDDNYIAGVNIFDDRIIYVQNYLEAAGYINCLNAGINPESIRFKGE